MSTFFGDSHDLESPCHALGFNSGLRAIRMIKEQIQLQFLGDVQCVSFISMVRQMSRNLFVLWKAFDRNIFFAR